MTLRLNSYRFWLRLWFYMLPLIAFAVSAYVRFFDLTWKPLVFDYDPRFYFIVLLLTTLIWAITVEHYRLCELEDLLSGYSGIGKASSACAATYFILVCVLFFYRHQDLSRIFFALSALLLLLLTLVSRALIRVLLHGEYRSPRPLRVLIIGADSYAQRLTARLKTVPLVRIQIVAHVRLPGQEVAIEGVPVHELADIGKKLTVPFDELVIALSSADLESLSDLVCKLQPLHAPIRTILDIGDVPIVRDRLFQFGNLQMLDLTTAPVESPHYFVSKRAFDLVFSIFAIIFMSPLMLVIALVIKLNSRGPILFRQERVGLNGRGFTMYKFRTMTMSPICESDTRWTNVNDPRRTAIGVFLRRSSLDELPQFFNVLMGEMSVVGPRPERPFFVGKFLEEVVHYNTRHRLKVGITGWAQVNGWRGDTSIEKRLECDLYYIQNWSFLFDLRIMWLTIWSGWFGENAH
jgi:Undecaprenyl-phosphate glucose phosphotransferase